MAKKIKVRRPGRLIIISGPSGVGKDSAISRIRWLNKRILLSISFTTRPMRPGEKDKKSYNFVSVEEFEDKIKNDEFLEYTKYCDNYYGTLKSPIVSALNSKHDIILKIDVDGAEKVKKSGLNCISIFISPPSFNELKDRINTRGLSEGDLIDKRLERLSYELEKSKSYDYIVVHDKVDSCVDEILEILERPTP